MQESRCVLSPHQSPCSPRSHHSLVMLFTVPFLNNAVLAVGDFVIVKWCSRTTGDSIAVFLVGGIQEVQSSTVKVTWWLTLDELREEGYSETPLPPALSDYSNLLKCQIKEVCKFHSEMVEININGIVDIAFLFHADTPREGVHQLCRYDKVLLHTLPVSTWWWIVVYQQSYSSTFICQYNWKFTIKDVVFYVGSETQCGKNVWWHKAVPILQKDGTNEMLSWILAFFCFAMTNSGAVILNYHRKYTEKKPLLWFIFNEFIVSQIFTTDSFRYRHNNELGKKSVWTYLWHRLPK